MFKLGHINVTSILNAKKLFAHLRVHGKKIMFIYFNRNRFSQNHRITTPPLHRQHSHQSTVWLFIHTEPFRKHLIALKRLLSAAFRAWRSGNCLNEISFRGTGGWYFVLVFISDAVQIPLSHTVHY